MLSKIHYKLFIYSTLKLSRSSSNKKMIICLVSLDSSRSANAAHSFSELNFSNYGFGMPGITYRIILEVSGRLFISFRGDAIGISYI